MASPELWFKQVEANFDTRSPKITVDSSKYNHVVQALPQEVLTECETAVNAEGDNRYQVLKEALISVYGKSTAQKGSELLALSSRPGSLGDRKPLSVMMRICSLSSRSYNNMDRAMLLNVLPQQVRIALASSTARSNDGLVKEADSIMEEYRISNLTRAAPHVSAVAPEPFVPSSATSPLAVEAAFHPRQDLGRGYNHRGSSGPSRSEDPLCFMHLKYGVYAYSCKSPATCLMKDKVSPAPGNGRAGH